MKFKYRLFMHDNVFDKGLQLPVGKIFQASELSIVKGGEIVNHLQWCDEITYVVSGKAKVFSDDNCAEIRAGQIHYIKKDCHHRIKVDSSENLRYFCMGFIPSENNEDIGEFLQAVNDKSHLILTDNSTIKKLSELILDEFYNWDSKSITMVNSYLTQILVTLERIINGRFKTAKQVRDEKQTAAFTVYQIIRYIDREYIKISSVKSIADSLSYNENYLSHLFKEKTGITIKDYLTKKKITYACELLKSSELIIEGIAEYLNFASAHTFRRVFKQHMGVSPSDYRKNLTAASM